MHQILLGDEGPSWSLSTVTALLEDAARFAALCKPWLPRSAWQRVQERLAYTSQGAERVAALWPGRTQLPCLNAVDRGHTRILERAGAPFKPCAGCGRPSEQLRSCSGCRSAAYCSRQCQLKHWKEGGHKRECKRLAAAAATAAAGGASSSSSG